MLRLTASAYYEVIYSKVHIVTPFTKNQVVAVTSSPLLSASSGHPASPTEREVLCASIAISEPCQQAVPTGHANRPRQQAVPTGRANSRVSTNLLCPGHPPGHQETRTDDRQAPAFCYAGRCRRSLDQVRCPKKGYNAEHQYITGL
jgi:hypothetical protein